jgi:hypothetical protein
MSAIEVLALTPSENRMSFPGNILTIRTPASRSPVSVRKLIAIVVLGVAITSELSWAVESCHIHPPGGDVLESEYPKLPLYRSLDECESANANYFGGAGRCHCFPDFLPREQGDIWPQPWRDFELPGGDRRR